MTLSNPQEALSWRIIVEQPVQALPLEPNDVRDDLLELQWGMSVSAEGNIDYQIWITNKQTSNHFLSDVEVCHCSLTVT